MRFKDRLNLFNNSEDKEIVSDNKIEFKQDIDISDIFIQNDKVSNIINSVLAENKNIIIASSIDCDNSINTQYIRTFIKNTEKVEVLYDINKDINFINANRIIVPDVNILEFVKILEFILYGYKSFVFTINIKSYDNILENIKTLISLYYKNLSESAIENLLGSSDSIIVYIDKNDDGLFFVSHIGSIEYKNKSLNIIDLYSISNSSEDIKSQCINLKDTKAIAKIDNIDYEANENNNYVDKETLTETELNEFVKNDIELDNEKSDNNNVKVNKYKLLKEKIKLKKQNN